ncbi:hypothetical protein QBC47DRAFT_377351 [Echria macrotheca]|uniref:Peptidoglycan binding-like domain-containing protein n=1 Tax=Echria macrotheca TaxID=438768 RepID=A0AAJ0BGD8_9PEZI|nr:hypothetical protein QBC47DRAFT_377351 [Echria macrotheca]
MKLSTGFNLLALATTPPVLAADGYCTTTSLKNVNLLSNGIVTVYHLSIPALSSSGRLNTNCIMNTGAKGAGVREVQTACNECYGANLDVDGDYGSQTKAAVKAMQKKLGLKGNDVDGIYGPQTGSLMRFYGWSSSDWRCVRAGADA